MIKHVVMWKFKKDTEAQMREFLNGLVGLKGQIDGLKSVEVGVNINDKNDFDAILVTEFDNMEDLQAYQTDPRHLAVAALCKEIRTDRVAVDYEV
jgi:heme-degrading monooxygenase HmoA